MTEDAPAAPRDNDAADVLVDTRDRDDGPAREGDRPARRPIRARVLTALACLPVLFALIAPSHLDAFTPLAFARIPLEGLLGIAVVLVLPARARRVTVSIGGAVLGLLAILKVFDIGFHANLDRPFHPVFDWPFLGAGYEYLAQSIGHPGAVAVAVVAVALSIAVLILMTLSARRLARVVDGHRTAAIRGGAVLGVAWLACAVLGAHIVPGVPVAAAALHRTLQVPADLGDSKTFAKQAEKDAFRDTPGQQLLTGLRGKDVMLAFVESYGRDAIEDPRYAPQVNAVLDAGSQRLRAAGYSSRSGFLTSPTFGAGSWLAHGTLLSGLWVNNQQRHDQLVSGDRLTLTRAFKRAGWRTAAYMPGNTKPWTEAEFYGHDRVYNQADLGYHGPPFNWGTPPDQYSLSVIQRNERARPKHAPVLTEIPLVSSHSPWAPTPRLIDWKNVGDGRAFGPMAASAEGWKQVWGKPDRIRNAYRRSIDYTLSALISYVETYGDKNLVIVFLGDHQPHSLVTGQNASRDVPITIVARDRAVIDRVSGWGWTDGLRPGPHAPVWPMSSFRDRFLTTFGSTPR